MTKLTHAEREIRRRRNEKRDRTGKVRRKFKLAKDEALNRVQREMRR